MPTALRAAAVVVLLARVVQAEPADIEVLPLPSEVADGASSEALEGAVDDPFDLPARPSSAGPPETGPPVDAFPEAWPIDAPAVSPQEELWEAEGWSAAAPPAGGHHWMLDWLGARHSSTHGRAVGAGGPLRGTSWLNRPYEVALEFGALVMTGDPADDVPASNDLFAAIHAGYDWDHYWGGQVRVGWSTPTFDNAAIAGEETSDNFFLIDGSVLYYPWGDSRTRPYCRVGIGLTDLEFTDSRAIRRQETLFTIPLAIGIKQQWSRTTVWRAEFANNLALGGASSNTMDNITLTLGVEGRFGGRARGYWAWSPRGRYR